MRKILYVCFFFVYICFAFEKDALSWDNEVTHKDLSSFAAENSVLSKAKDDYMRNCGFNKGLSEEFTWNRKKLTVIDWLRTGADLEDSSGPLSVGYIDGKGRSFNHFHNPLKPWTLSGLNDWVGPLHFTGKSSLIWAQAGAYQENFYEGNWSWNKTREYFYTALTGRDLSGSFIAPDEMSRSEYFARTFRGLGHQMHLLQDMSVPDHVRDDAHPEDSLFGRNPFTGNPYFESWAKNYRKIINSFAAKPISPNVPLNVSYNGLAPITQLYDTDRYDGLNASAGINQGLAEYTNANFFSNDTIFAAESYSTDNGHYFPFPRKSSTDLQYYIDQKKLPEIVVGEDSIPDTTFYIRKERDGETINHFVKPGYFTEFIDPILDLTLYARTFYRDEKCHEDYDRLLIPRAVGYSAALLDYFFRGNIEISLPSSGIYSSTGDGNAGFTRMTLLAVNNTSNGDEMSNGSIELVVKYRLAASDPFKTGPVQTSDYNYKVVPVSSGVTSIPKDTPAELSFDLTNTPLPVNAVDVSLLVVYHGKLGMEDGAVAVGFKDISDPTPVDIYNNMDKICLNGAWYDAGSQAAIQQVDKNGDGIAYGTNEWDVYPHNLSNVYIKFYRDKATPDYASATYYDYEVGSIAPRGFIRALYVLGDDNFNYSFYAVREGTDQYDSWEHVDPGSVYNGFTIKNQVEDPPTFFSFRGYSMWPGSGFIYVNPAYPEHSQCDLGLLR
jgi:hypothetical protein